MGIGEHKHNCAECGAPRIENLNCWEQLGILLSWEWEDPELRALHFLTVSSYNLQHPAQFTAEALEGLRQLFIEYLDNELPVAEIRRRVARETAGNKRVLKKEDERKRVSRQWTRTIAEVYIPNQPSGAPGRVREWATSIRNDL